MDLPVECTDLWVSRRSRGIFTSFVLACHSLNAVADFEFPDDVGPRVPLMGAYGSCVYVLFVPIVAARKADEEATVMNLSHVIHEFSFGPFFPRISQPLDNSAEITPARQSLSAQDWLG